MARNCKTCSHPERASVDLKLMQGQSANSIAKEHNLKIDAILRHRDHHLPKASEASSTAMMMKQVIQELDLLALTALSRGDHRSATDARKRKADCIQFLLQQEKLDQKNNVAEREDGSAQIPMEVIDSIMKAVEKNHDPCPTCGAHTLPKGVFSLPKATGQKSGNVLN